MLNLREMLGSALGQWPGFSWQEWLSVGDEESLGWLFLVFLMFCVLIEHYKPFLRPGLQTLKNSYLTNLYTFLFNDVSLSWWERFLTATNTDEHNRD